MDKKGVAENQTVAKPAMMADPIRVVFMGTPDFALPTLEALADHPSFMVTMVVTQPDRPKGRGKKLAPSPVKSLALGRDIPVIEPAKVSCRESVKAINGAAPDFLAVAAYGQILPESVLNIPKLAPVNLHASLLPKWRGAAPIQRSFLSGDTVTGVCSMLMAKGMDTGDILLLRQTQIKENDTFAKLHNRLAMTGAALMVETLLDFVNGQIEPVKQDESMATYASKISREDCYIDWGKPAGEVDRHIRGLSPSPGAESTLNEKTIKPLFTKALMTGKIGEQGQIVGITKDGIEVTCGSGSVIITKLKPVGKNEMPAYAYTLGQKTAVGDFFR